MKDHDRYKDIKPLTFTGVFLQGKKNKENLKYHYLINLNIYEGLWKTGNCKLFLKTRERELI